MIADGGLTSLAFCWRLERRDGAGLGLTSHDRAVVVDGVTYRSSPGMTPSAVRLRAGIEPQSGEVGGALTDAALTERDFEIGRWDGARISLSAVDWGDPQAPALALVGGGLGPVTMKDGEFTADLIGAAAALSAPACPDTSPECRAELGDRACRVDLAEKRERFEAVSLDGNRLTLDRVVGDRFAFGEACIVGGTACGWRSRVLGVEDATVVLRDPPLAEIASGTSVRLTEGCDKRFATCRTRFANSANFRGEPHLPGNDLLTRYPGA